MKISPRISTLKYFVAFLVIFICNPVQAEAKKPNVIVIMADDLGAEGLNCYGSSIYTTPHLDKMAAEGVRFNNAYATPLCTPTRVMIMSGLYPNRTGHMALMGKSKTSRLSAEIRTFGHDFKEAGYKTAIAGKWQLGQFDQYPAQTIEHGFDEYCMWSWFYEGAKRSRFFKPHFHTAGKFVQGKENEFGPDFYSDFVFDFIDRNKDEPFFIYFPMALVHSPFIVPPRLKELGHSKYKDSMNDMDKHTINFGHMITYMDDLLGKLMAKLKEHAIDQNTLVIFTADNGTHKAITSQLPGMALKGGKGSLTEAGTRVPFIAWWPKTIKPAVKDEFFCLVDVLPTVTSIADIKLNREVDGMDLSHHFLGTEGQDRELVFMTWKTGSFIRGKRFRLNAMGKVEKGLNWKFYDIPVTSDQTRYSEKISDNPEHEARRKQLKEILEQYLAIERKYNINDKTVQVNASDQKQTNKSKKDKQNKKANQ